MRHLVLATQPGAVRGDLVHSISREASFVVLGVLLLAATFAYQRQRPPPVPDLRGVSRSLR